VTKDGRQWWDVRELTIDGGDVRMADGTADDPDKRLSWSGLGYRSILSPQIPRRVEHVTQHREPPECRMVCSECAVESI
jgi:hypothetical protein